MATGPRAKYNIPVRRLSRPASAQPRSRDDTPQTRPSTSELFTPLPRCQTAPVSFRAFSEGELAAQGCMNEIRQVDVTSLGLSEGERAARGFCTSRAANEDDSPRWRLMAMRHMRERRQVSLTRGAFLEFFGVLHGRRCRKAIVRRCRGRVRAHTLAGIFRRWLAFHDEVAKRASCLASMAIRFAKRRMNQAGSEVAQLRQDNKELRQVIMRLQDDVANTRVAGTKLQEEIAEAIKARDQLQTVLDDKDVKLRRLETKQLFLTHSHESAVQQMKHKQRDVEQSVKHLREENNLLRQQVADKFTVNEAFLNLQRQNLALEKRCAEDTNSKRSKTEAFCSRVEERPPKTVGLEQNVDKEHCSNRPLSDEDDLDDVYEDEDEDDAADKHDLDMEAMWGSYNSQRRRAQSARPIRATVSRPTSAARLLGRGKNRPQSAHCIPFGPMIMPVGDVEVSEQARRDDAPAQQKRLRPASARPAVNRVTKPPRPFSASAQHSAVHASPQHSAARRLEHDRGRLEDRLHTARDTAAKLQKQADEVAAENQRQHARWLDHVSQAAVHVWGGPR